MKYVEVTIRISEHDKSIIDRFVDKKGYRTLPPVIRDNAIRAIRYGVVLPKGHGNLGDLDAFEQFCWNHDIANSALDGHPIVATGKYSDGDSIWEDLFTEENAPIILRADNMAKKEQLSEIVGDIRALYNSLEEENERLLEKVFDEESYAELEEDKSTDPESED